MTLPVLGRDKRDRATAYEDAVAQARRRSAEDYPTHVPCVESRSTAAPFCAVRVC